jgi:hypothetical protein
MANRGRLLIFVVVVVVLLLTAMQFTNDGGQNRHFSDEEVAAKLLEVKRVISDDRLCQMHYHLSTSLFGKLHNRFIGVVKESDKLPLYFQVAIYLDYIAHGTSFREQFIQFKVSVSLIILARRNIRNAIMYKVYPQYVRPQLVDEEVEGIENTTRTPRGLKEGDLDTKSWEKFKHFEGCMGNIDGSHIKICSDAETNTAFFSSRKKAVTTNVQFVATVNKSLMFTHAYVGIEGRASDAQSMRLAAFALDLEETFGPWTRGRFLIGDAGYALSFKMLTPYRGVMYHLREFNVRQENNENQDYVKNMYELFNLRHAMFRNEVERAFGVLKKRFKVLVNGIQGYDLNETWNTIYSCIAIHNFIRYHLFEGNGSQATSDARILLEVDAEADTETALAAARMLVLDGEQDAPNLDVNGNQALAGTPSAWRDQIASEMWADYTRAE